MVKLISLLTVGALLDATRAVDIDAMRRDLVQAIDAGAVKNTTECHARLLTYEYSLALLPARAPLLDAFDALELEATCGVPRPAPGEPAFPPHSEVPDGAVFVAVGGSDGGAGTAADPFATAARALAATRAGGAPKAIVFRGGVHFLGATLELDGRDSGLLLTNFENETAWLSGGVPLATTWARVANATYETRIAETFPYRGTILGLNVIEPHRRFVRARYPNGGGSVGVETRSGVGQVKSSDILSYGAPPVVPPAAQVYVADPAYAASASEHFNAYRPAWKSSTRLQCERIRPFEHKLFGCASRARGEQSICPKITRIDFDLAELEISEVWSGPPFHAGTRRADAPSPATRSAPAAPGATRTATATGSPRATGAATPPAAAGRRWTGATGSGTGPCSRRTSRSRAAATSRPARRPGPPRPGARPW